MTIALFLAAVLAAAQPMVRPIQARGPLAPLAGTYTDAGNGAPVILIIPGSGPTDRDGNNPLGVKAAPYKLLSSALASNGISSVRIDKRGMFGSKAAIADANKVSVDDYAEDTRSWIGSIARETGAKCVWLLGHSEGSLIALTAAQDSKKICGVISVAGVGRRMADVMRQQLRANPANAPILPAALGAIDSLEAGRKIDSSSLPPALQPLFNEAVQPFLIDLFSQDPAGLAARLKLPLLIVQGDSDFQVTVEDARALAAAQPNATLAILPGVNHVLKVPQGNDRVANLAAYANPDLPLAPGVIDAIAKFVQP